MLQSSLVRRIHFSAGHRYAVKDWDEAKNKSVFGLCYSEKGHGHNYSLDAYVSGPVDSNTGMIINLRDLDLILKDVVSTLDHHFINTDVPEFENKVPTTENLALYCYQRAKERLPKNVSLNQIRLFETEELWVDVVKT